MHSGAFLNFFLKKKPSSLDPLFQNYSSNCSLCTSCKDHYVNLTKHFSRIGGDVNDENSMCMDVVDLVEFISTTKKIFLELIKLFF